MSYVDLRGLFGAGPAERWTVEGPVDGGTLATLWRVRDQRGGPMGCAKVVPPDAGVPGPARRFGVERAALERLPVRDDLLRLLDTSVAADGTGLLVTAFVEGTNLRRRLASGGPVAVATAVRWTLGLLEALQAVHAAGLVHCDVKPDNVLLVDDGARVVLVDFGLATPTGEPCAAAGGATAGTPRYMAPEQVRGGAVDARTDTYAVGIVLYELLTGAPPFTGSANADVRTQQLQSRPVPPDVVAFDGDVPGALSEVVLKALEKQPDARFPTAAALQAALHPFAG